MYPGGGMGYPPNPSAGGYPGHQPQHVPGIGFDSVAGGAPHGQPNSYGYGAPPSGSQYPSGPAGYPSGPAGYPGGGPQAPYPASGGPPTASYPSGGAPYPGGGSAPYPGGGGGSAPYPGGGSAPYPGGGSAPYPGGSQSYNAPYNATPSFSGAAFAATAAMNFRPQQNYPQQPPQPYGNAQQQPPSFSGAAFAATAANNFRPSQQSYPQQPSQPYGNTQQQPYPSNQPYGSNQHVPTQELNKLHLNSTSTVPKRPAPPSSNKTTAHGQIPKLPATQGTMKDATGFDAQRDSEILRKAMKGIGTDEKAITAVLGCRSNKQRQRIKIEFATMYGKDLIKELKSELSGNYETAVLELLMTPAEYDAYQCYNAISGLGTDEKCLIEILCSRSNTEIQALRDAYKRTYKRELERDIVDDTSGNFERLLVSLVQGNREENAPLDHQKAAQDANALYQAGEAKWGTDESRFNVILGSRSIPQLHLIFNEYEKISKKRSLEKAISSEMSGDLKDGMLSVVKCTRNRAAFLAERLYWSMKGLGTDDKTLIRIMVSRCEIDMVQIKQEFQRAYSKTLDSFINDDCSGDYKKILLQLCKGN